MDIWFLRDVKKTFTSFVASLGGSRKVKLSLDSESPSGDPMYRVEFSGVYEPWELVRAFEELAAELRKGTEKGQLAHGLSPGCLSARGASSASAKKDEKLLLFLKALPLGSTLYPKEAAIALGVTELVAADMLLQHSGGRGTMTLTVLSVPVVGGVLREDLALAGLADREEFVLSSPDDEVLVAFRVKKVLA